MVESTKLRVGEQPGLGTAPEHKAVVDGDEKSAAIAAASVVAKVVRDRTMRRLAALYPHYGFSSHVGYITPGHSAVVRERGPSEIHRRSFEARCYAEQLTEPTSDEVRIDDSLQTGFSGRAAQVGATS